MASPDSTEVEKKPVRVWVDGCFDMVHFGHANAIRQAKSLGDYLIVGVHSDEEIEYHKGPSVFTSQERYKMVRAIKWVDEVVEAAPYITTVETVDKYNCDNERATFDQMASAATCRSPYTATCQFVPTTERLKEFSTGRAPEPGEKIAFVCGAFDLFHVGHIDFLKKCYSMATYVIIGIHSDQTVNWYRGYNYPIMTMFERVLSVLACRYVSNVVIDAPYKISEQLMKHLKVNYVIHGVRTPVKPCNDGSDPYSEAKRLGLYREVDSGNEMTAYSVIERIIKNRVKFEERNRSKEQKELSKMQSA